MANHLLTALQNQSFDPAALGQTIDKAQRDLAQAIKAGWSAPGVDRAQALFTALRAPLPATFAKEMRAILARHKQDGDYALLIAAVQKLFDQYQLANASAQLTPEPEPITREDLELVCWMLIA